MGARTAQACQGFFVGDNRMFVTAWHVCALFNPMWVNLGPKGCFPVDAVLASDEMLDCIVLRIKDAPPDVHVLTLSSIGPTVGDVLFDVRRRDDGTTAFTPVEYLEDSDTSLTQDIKVRGDIRHGYSGSAVVDSAGRAVGLMCGGGHASEMDSRAASWHSIADLLHEAQSSFGQSYAAWRKKSFGSTQDEFLLKSNAAIDAYSAKEYDKCILYAREALNLNPQNARMMHYSLGAMRLQGLSYERCMVWILDRVSESGETWFTSRTMGDSLMHEKRFSDAANFYSISLSLEPHYSTQYWLAQALDRQGKQAEALAVMRDAAAKWPGRSSAYESIRSLAQSMHDVDQVHESNQRLMELNPRDPTCLYNCAQWTLSSESKSAATAMQKSLWASNPYLGGRLAMELLATKVGTAPGVSVPRLPVYLGPANDAGAPGKPSTP